MTYSSLTNDKNARVSGRGQCGQTYPANSRPAAQQAAIVAGIPGMPTFVHDQPPLSFFEFWPPKLFYIPIAVAWLILSLRHRSLTLPTVANPLFLCGGLVGEQKSRILDQVDKSGRKWFARHLAWQRDDSGESVAAETTRVLQALTADGLGLPVVAKPDLGCRGVGVRCIKSEAELKAYLACFPPGQTIVFQEYIPHEPEAGILYVCYPGEAKGFIFSITLKYFPRVIGDGESTLRQLIEGDPRAGKIAHVYLPRHRRYLDRVLEKGEVFRLNFAGSHSRGTIFRNGNRYITPELEEIFDRVAKTIPEFYFGRFDVRFPHFDALQSGTDFTIVEINGAGAEATCIWDSSTSLSDAYRKLIHQFRILFAIGSRNRDRGFKPVGLRQLYRLYRLESMLIKNYPPTE
jgi:hypothetical protein